MFGGKTVNDVILSDFWVLDLITMEWFFVDYKNTTNNYPKPKFLPIYSNSKKQQSYHQNTTFLQI